MLTSDGAPPAGAVKTAVLVALVCAMPAAIVLALSAPLEVPTGYYYWELGDSVLRHGVLGFGGQPSTAFSPLYPAFLAWGRWITGDRLELVMALQVAVAAVGAVYFFRLSLLLSGDVRVAWIATLLHAFYPYYVRQSIGVIEITLFKTLLIATTYYVCRAEGTATIVAGGIASGLMLLVRVASLPIVLFAIAWLAIRRRVRDAVLFAGCAFIMFSPFLLRNVFLDGSWLPSRSGVNLFVGNCGCLGPHHSRLQHRHPEPRLRRGGLVQPIGEPPCREIRNGTRRLVHRPGAPVHQGSPSQDAEAETHEHRVRASAEARAVLPGRARHVAHPRRRRHDRGRGCHREAPS